MNQTFISDLKQHIGTSVTIKGWLAGSRSSGKIAFLQLRDGTGFVQGVIAKNDAAEEIFELAKGLTLESSVVVIGDVREDSRSPNGVELTLRHIEQVSPAENYPITPKEHGVDFLMENRHLYLRHRGPWAIMRLRDEVIRALHDFFAERGFIKFDSPFFMPTAVEGTTNLFEIDLFEEDKAYLSQSGQLYAEAGALALGKVYTLGPTFRAEKSKTRRHLLEFWMIEPEVAYADWQDNMNLQEAMVSYVIKRVLEKKRFELDLLKRDVSKLEPASQGGFPRISYDEAIHLINEKIATKDLPENVDIDTQPVPWGEDFGAPHETIIGAQFDRPVMIHSYPAKIKAFYMQPQAHNPLLAACNDMIAPEGYGELIGGSQRIHDYDLLRQRIKEHDLPQEAFAWYVDLRKYGSVPHSGFGMGLERFLAWITGVHHLREVIPFPRMLTRMYP
jgi:asparaginyl-tRNA synthetase